MAVRYDSEINSKDIDGCYSLLNFALNSPPLSIPISLGLG